MSNANICSKNVVLDYRTDIKAVNALRNYGFNIVHTKKLDALYDAVNGHTDLQIVQVGDNLIVCPECYEYYREQNLKNLICGTSKLSDKYPNDISYNAAIFGRFAVHNFKFCDVKLRECIKEKSLIEIDTKQGYSKCSICVISDRAIITEDDSILKSAEKYNIDVLKISKGSVKLKGFDYGFFGGATGLYQNTLFVNGELKFHTDGEKIKAFCKKYGVCIEELNSGEICDIGTILFTI